MVWVELLILAGSIVVHEFGHMLAMFYTKDKFFIKFKWYGIVLEYVEPWGVKVNSYVLNLYAGVFAGFMFIFVMNLFVSFNLGAVLMVYFVMLAIDITNFVTSYKFLKKGSTLTLFEMIEGEYLKWKKEKEKKE